MGYLFEMMLYNRICFAGRFTQFSKMRIAGQDGFKGDPVKGEGDHPTKASWCADTNWHMGTVIGT